ncbi:MAG: DUF695 domain-containing protein [Anaerolineales bacterium]|nr:DUF695 domain-containing protein [Anaerolineales bacterium]
MAQALTEYITGGPWEVYSYLFQEKQRIIVSFNVNRALQDQHDDLPHCARLLVYAPIEFVDAEGLPDGDILQPLAELEDKIMEILAKHNIACQFVGRLTYNGVREFIFQVDPASLPHFHEITDEIIHRSPLEMARKEELGWRFFDENIRPSLPMWQQIQNRHRLEMLETAGVDLEIPHQLEHFFSGTAVQLLTIANQLQQDGFQLVSHQNSQLTLALHNTYLDLDSLTDLTTTLHNYAAALGASYEGWQVNEQMSN